MKKTILTTLFAAGLLTSALYAGSNATSEHMMSKDECFTMCKESSTTNDAFKKDALFNKVLESVTSKDPYSG